LLEGDAMTSSCPHCGRALVVSNELHIVCPPIELATRACELTGWEEPSSLATLAAAYAEAGAKDEAVRWARQALEFAADAEKAARQTELERYLAR
jgi:hypothetical protein